MDGEDDYMGDLSRFLPPESAGKWKSKASPAAQLECSSKSKPKFPTAHLSWQERRRLGNEKRREEEDQQTLAKMEECPIPQSNIGFKLLKQMGYDSESSPMVDPVRIEIRRTRVGIGREDPGIEKRRREAAEQETKRQRTEEIAAEFGDLQRSRWRARRLVVNYVKAKSVLDQLEGKDVVTTKEGEEAELSEEAEDEDAINEEGLLELLQKLRDGHRYCLFCGFQYESSEALLSACPGIGEEDH